MSRLFHPRSRLLAGVVSLTVLLGVSLVLTTSVLSQSGGLIPPDQILLRRGTDPPSPPDGPALFLGNCATCHDNHNPGDDDPSDNARTILRGVGDGPTSMVMPAFADFLSNDEIATLANFLARQAGNSSANITPAQVAQLR
jgi:cytochrome c553